MMNVDNKLASLAANRVYYLMSDGKEKTYRGQTEIHSCLMGIQECAVGAENSTS